MTILVDTEVSVIAPNFETLKTTISTYLNRSDLDSQIPIFIEMAHRRFNRTLFVQDRERSYQDTVADGYALPGDFYQMRSLTIVSGDDTPLAQVPYDVLKSEAEWSGTPQRYAISGQALYFSPQAGSGVVMDLAYYARIPMLGTFQASNWLLEKHPDAYVYGALVQATALLDASDARVGLWSAALDQTIDEILDAGNKAAYGGGSLVMRPPVVV